MGKNFTAIYRILRLLDKYNGQEDFSYEEISASAVGMSFGKWEQIMIELQKNGYIRGLAYTQGTRDAFPHIVEPMRPQITLKGMEYLEENSMMAKAKEALRMIGELL